MSYPVLLLTPEAADAPWTRRVRTAFPADLPLEVTVAPAFLAPPDGRGWLMVLVDSHTPPQAFADLRLAPAPRLWLGQAPNLAVMPHGWTPADWLDLLDRAWPTSKLAFVLHQHLGDAYLRWVRGRGLVRSPHASADELQRAINNALTGLLGNAALAVDGAARMPPPVQRRLRSIVELSAELRDLLAEAAPPEASGSRLRAA